VQMLTWGLDVSTNRGKTAAVALDWSAPGEARIVEVCHPLGAVDIAPLIAKHGRSRWAVDVPFGWPELFVALMADRHQGPLPAEAIPAVADWEVWRTRRVAQRGTVALSHRARPAQQIFLPAASRQSRRRRWAVEIPEKGRHELG
jgi:hypothetical protein